jgi:hemoglobin
MNMNTHFQRSFLVFSLVAALTACTAPQRGATGKSLYERLGGKPAIQAVVDDFIGNVAADSRINRFFANANIPRLKSMLVDQICEASGGPCKYTGESMKEAHAGMGITEAHFNALVEDLVKSLDKLRVPAKEKNELLAALASMKPDMVVPFPNTVRRDGELGLPADYRSWPVKLLGVERPDLKQVRDIYVNSQGSLSSQPFPYGTVLVMELYSARGGSDGQLVRDAAGSLEKGALTRIFVMGKGFGWGEQVPSELRTGEWVFASYGPDGRPAAGDLNACRSCHVPFKDRDFVARANEYEARSKAR